MILELYNFHHKQEEQQEQEHQSDNKIENEEQAKRIAQLRRDQELADFEEKGGLARILNNLFNPKDESIELDSVYQLKQLWKSYYETKSKISKDLIETLDALLNERPHAIKMKKQSFYVETDDNQEEDPLLGKRHRNYYLDIEWMRLNAEKERICHYRDIARKSAIKYYKVLKEIIRLNLIHVMGSKTSPDKAQNERSSTKNDKKGSHQTNFYQLKETKINWIYYITDYLKLVIENGNEFMNFHLFQLIDTLIPEELSDEVMETLKIVIKEFEFEKKDVGEWIKAWRAPKRKKRNMLKLLEDVNFLDE
jgi:glucan-binding YG repeat protein